MIMGTRQRVTKALCASSDRNKAHVAMMAYSKPKRPYTRCFGRLVPLTEDEIKNTTINIIWL